MTASLIIFITEIYNKAKLLFQQALREVWMILYRVAGYILRVSKNLYLHGVDGGAWILSKIIFDISKSSVHVSLNTRRMPSS